MTAKGNKQSLEEINKRVPNSGSFKKGHESFGGNESRFKKGLIPHNKGKLISLNLDNLTKEYLDNEKSTNDLSKELGVSSKTISNRLNGLGVTLRKKHTERTKQKIKTKRANQITPVKDTSIEIKVQDYLKQLGIEFLTHQYIKEITHGYQCDIIIPVQEGINKKTIIECFGTYWHNYPLGRQIDIDRCNELREAGWRVLIFWENEIKVMELENLQEVISR